MKLFVCKNNLRATFCTKVPTLLKNGVSNISTMAGWLCSIAIPKHVFDPSWHVIFESAPRRNNSNAVSERPFAHARYNGVHPSSSFPLINVIFSSNGIMSFVRPLAAASVSAFKRSDVKWSIFSPYSEQKYL